MKLLTGKCKKDFKEWFYLKNMYISLSDRFYEEFKEMPLTMQYGVMEDFFIDKNLILHIEPYFILSLDNELLCFKNKLLKNKDIDSQNSYLDINTARKKVIEKANKIYNKQNT